MTSRQRFILKAGLIAAALAGLFPPWQVDMAAAGTGASGIVGVGRHFMFGSYHYWRLDFGGLLISWAVIALVAGAAFVVVERR
jgi:hypothetical protein